MSEKFLVKKNDILKYYTIEYILMKVVSFGRL